MCLARHLDPVAVTVLMSPLSSLSSLPFLVVIVQYCHHPSLHGSRELQHHDVQFLRNCPSSLKLRHHVILLMLNVQEFPPLFLPPLSSLTRLNLDLEKAKQTQLKDMSKNMSWAFGMFLRFVTNNFLDFFRFYLLLLTWTTTTETSNE